MKQKYTKPEVSSVEFKMEQGYAASASQGVSRLGAVNELTWHEDYQGSGGDRFFGTRTTGYFGGSTDNWD